jgi:hypothetical protein
MFLLWPLAVPEVAAEVAAGASLTLAEGWLLPLIPLLLAQEPVGFHPETTPAFLLTSLVVDSKAEETTLARLGHLSQIRAVPLPLLARVALAVVVREERVPTFRPALMVALVWHRQLLALLPATRAVVAVLCRTKPLRAVRMVAATVVTRLLVPLVPRTLVVVVVVLGLRGLLRNPAGAES